MRRFDSGRPLQSMLFKRFSHANFMPRGVVLSRIIAPLRRHVLSGAGQRRSASQAASQYGATPLEQWPALLQVAVLRGEAVLQDRFFGIFLDQLVTRSTPEQALAYWQRFVLDGCHLQNLVQRIGLGTAAKTEAGIAITAAGGNYKALYCALLHELNQAAQSDAADAGHCARLLSLACEGFFNQLWHQQFPQEGSAPPAALVKKDLASLKQRLLVALQRRHKGPVQLRESFKTLTETAEATEATETTQATNEVLRFSVQAKVAGHWQVLCTVDRPRLKTARLAAYEAALKAVGLSSQTDQ